MGIVNSLNKSLSHFATIANFYEVDLLNSQDQSTLPQVVMICIQHVDDELVIALPDRNLPLSIISLIEEKDVLVAFQIESLNDAKYFTKIFPNLVKKDAFVVSSCEEVLAHFYSELPALIPVFDIRNSTVQPLQLLGEMLRTRSMLLMVLPSQIATLDFKIARTQGLRLWVESADTSLVYEKKYIHVVYGLYTHSTERLYNTLNDTALKIDGDSVASIAHRGIPVWSPENSLRGIQQAIEHKADIVEFDIHTALDHELIVIHDDTTLRTTGYDYAIHSTTSDVIHDLKLVNKRSTDNEQNVPLFSQTIPLLHGSSTAAFIEIKDNNPLTSTLLFAQIEQSRSPFSYQVISFHTEQLKRVSDLQKCRVGWLNDVVKEGDSIEQALMKICPNVIPMRASYNPYFGPLSDELVYQLHLRGIAVWPWTIDNEDDMIRMIDMNVDGITSNNLPLLQSVLRRGSHAE